MLNIFKDKLKIKILNDVVFRCYEKKCKKTNERDRAKSAQECIECEWIKQKKKKKIMK